MATIKEVASLCQVSVTTVSRVLSQDKTMLVTEQTRRQIYETAHRIGYIPPKQRKVNVQQELIIAVVDWHIVEPNKESYNLMALSGLARRLYPEQSVRFIHLPKKEIQQVDGILAFGEFSDQEIDELNAISYHIVFINSDSKEFVYDRIMIELEPALQEAMQYLRETKHCTKISYLGGYYLDQGIEIGVRRQAIIRHYFQKFHCYDPEYFQLGHFSKESGREMFLRDYNRDDLPQAYLLGSDEIAAGVIEAMEENLSSCDKPLLIVYRDMRTVNLTRSLGIIDIYTDFMWENAIEMLLERVLKNRSIAKKLVISAHFSAAN